MLFQENKKGKWKHKTPSVYLLSKYVTKIFERGSESFFLQNFIRLSEAPKVLVKSISKLD